MFKKTYKKTGPQSENSVNYTLVSAHISLKLLRMVLIIGIFFWFRFSALFSSILVFSKYFYFGAPLNALKAASKGTTFLHSLHICLLMYKRY